MKILFKKLILVTRKQEIEVEFSSSITYFYGKMGAGKSTIPHLIDYCFGSDLNEPAALQNEFLSVKLDLVIENYNVILQRDKDSNRIFIVYSKNGQNESLIVPVRAGREVISIIEGKKVFNISDFIFIISGLNPPMVTRSKIEEDSDIMRLSIRDLLWYCYLDQDEIDSSFFYLGKEENPFRRNKSKDVILYILGYNQELVSQIRDELSRERQKYYSLKESIETLRNYFIENNIPNPLMISQEITEKRRQLIVIEQEILNLESKLLNLKPHPVDLLKENSRHLTDHIFKIQSDIEDTEFKITEQERLRNEFLTAIVKSNRLDTSKKIFNEIKFVTCPQCNSEINSSKDSVHICHLCKEPLHNSDSRMPDFSGEIRMRIGELDESLSILYNDKIKLNRILKTLLEKKKLVDADLIELEKKYDSKYLAYGRSYENTKGLIQGRIDFLEQLLKLSTKVEEMEKALKLSEENSYKIKLRLDDAIKKFEKDNNNLRNLRKYFFENLQRVAFPGLTSDDKITITSNDLIPYISSQNEIAVTNFYNLGSGGKKTIFKACFALAVHQVARQINSPLPTFLIIDTPMKNISERENKDVFENFYELVYDLAQGELSDLQMILIDKEYYPPSELVNVEVVSRHMSPDDPKYPPLIPYYKGH